MNAVLVASCLPAPPIGHIVYGPQKKGRVVLSVQAGGGGSLDGYGAGGALHVEPFVSKRLSIPISIAAAWYRDLCVFDIDDARPDRITSGSFSARVGIRGRIGSSFTVGAGIGGGVANGTNYYDDPDGEWTASGADFSIPLDFEWSVGRSWHRVAISFAQRLAWDAPTLVGFKLTSELSLAWYPSSKNVAVTTTLFVHWIIPWIPSGGATVGLAFVL